MQRPLEGLHVLDFSQIVAGPATGMYLADMGAEVIKIEPPNGGRDRASGRTNTRFLLVNRGKRSLVLDIRAPAGREVVGQLVRRADVMLIAWPPGQADRLGYGYEEMHSLNPRIVYASVTGWGNRGPLAMKRGYDLLVQAHTGLMASNDAPDGRPLEIPFFVADMAIPMLLSYGIMLALWARERTGQGQKVEVSQVEAQLAMQCIHLVSTDKDIDNPDRREDGRQTTHVYGTRDGRHLVVLPLTEQEWMRLWHVLGLTELAADPRLRSSQGRREHHAFIDATLARCFAGKSLADWIEALSVADVPHSAVQSRTEFMAHPHGRENGLFTEASHREAGRMRWMAPPVRLSSTPGRAGEPAPDFGQHSVEILQELGYSAEAIEAMKREGIIG